MNDVWPNSSKESHQTHQSSELDPRVLATSSETNWMMDESLCPNALNAVAGGRGNMYLVPRFLGCNGYRQPVRQKKLWGINYKQ